ncbi:MAG: hypothetical protein DI628_01080 [Blastochloris viridis]|uniref:Uncharacterized protein n=1 Tax=Blastochloris viridis TaxID=1079 RepID=A0A6N4RB16_BLAVI|nr:MAG: hypothetical protein DI628_01080 [Blastochloris viridis]
MEHLTTRIIAIRITLLIGVGVLILVLLHKNLLSLPLAIILVLISIGAYMFATQWLAAAVSYRTEFWYNGGVSSAYHKKQIALSRQKLDELEQRFAGALSDAYDIYSFARARKALNDLDRLLMPGLKLGYFGHLYFKREVLTFISLLEDDLPQASAELAKTNIIIPEEPQKRYNKLRKYFHEYLARSEMDEPETRYPRSEVLTKGYLKLNAYI